MELRQHRIIPGGGVHRNNFVRQAKSTTPLSCCSFTWAPLIFSRFNCLYTIENMEKRVEKKICYSMNEPARHNRAAGFLNSGVYHLFLASFEITKQPISIKQRTITEYIKKTADYLIIYIENYDDFC